MKKSRKHRARRVGCKRQRARLLNLQAGAVEVRNHVNDLADAWGWNWEVARGSVTAVGRGAALACSAMHFTSLHFVPSFMLQKEKRLNACVGRRLSHLEVKLWRDAPAAVVD